MTFSIPYPASRFDNMNNFEIIRIWNKSGAKEMKNFTESYRYTVNIYNVLVGYETVCEYLKMTEMS